MSITGKCKCGSVQVAFDTSFTPAFAAHCLCRGCREWTGTPVWSVCGYRGPDAAKAVVVTAGEDVLKRYRHPGLSFDRCFCSNCGTAMFNSKLGDDGVQLFVGVSICIFDEADSDKIPKINRIVNPESKACWLDFDSLSAWEKEANK